MNISDQQLEKFIELYQKEFGIALDRNIALEKAIGLVQLVKIIYKPIKINQK